MQHIFLLYPFLIKYKYRLLIGIILIIIADFFNILPAYYVGKLIDSIKLLLIDDSNKTILEKGKKLFFYGGLILILPITDGIIKFFMRKILLRTSRLIEFDVKNQIYTKYQNLDFLALKKHTTGDLINRLTEDLSTIRLFLGPGFIVFIHLFVLFIIVSIQMIRIDISLSLYSLLPIISICIGVLFLSKKSYKISQVIQKKQSLISSSIEDTFSGIHIIKSFVIENYFKKKHTPLFKNYKQINVKFSKIESFLNLFTTFFIGISHLAILYIGGLKYINGQIEQIGQLAEFFIYVNMLMWSLTPLGWSLSTLQKAISSQKRIKEFLEATPPLDPTRKKPFYFSEKIVFKSIGFTYENTSKEVLKNASFTLEKGKILNIIGENGSGKSTIAHLLSQLLNSSKGEIFIDETNIETIILAELRKNLTYVFQENILFSESIWDNIISYEPLDKKNKDELYNLVDQSAQYAQIQEDIIRLEKGYDTLLGKKGIALSGGQKQRIAIARALFKRAPILILDDIFSAIDQKTKKRILRYFKENPYKQTIILLSPDQSLVDYAHQVLFLENKTLIKKEIKS